MIAVPPPKVLLERLESLFDDTRATEMLLWRADFLVNGILVVGVIAYRLPTGSLEIMISTRGSSEPLSESATTAVDRKFRALIRHLDRSP